MLRPNPRAQYRYVFLQVKREEEWTATSRGGWAGREAGEHQLRTAVVRKNPTAWKPCRFLVGVGWSSHALSRCRTGLVPRAVFTSRGALALENLALRQQLATYVRAQKRPRLKSAERAFWVALSRVWLDWRSPLVFVKPTTVIDWHRRVFRRYWRWRSRKPGRPRIPDEHIALIRRISRDHPEWGEDRIAEELAIKLAVKHSTSTIRKYMVRRREPRGGQTWKTFVKNHASQIFAVDFLTQPTALFTIVYVFVVMEIATRRIVLINATTSPGLEWVS